MTQKKNQNIACIFPAFGTKYLSNELEILTDFQVDLDYFLSIAEIEFDFNRELFYQQKDGLFKNELTSQYATYIYSCAVSDLLKRRKINSIYSAGYSMGLYATLYHNECISFIEGLLFIKYAYKYISHACQNLNFSMGIIVGLSEKDVCKILKKVSQNVEIINTNNTHSRVISGLKSDVEKCITMAKEEGSINAQVIPMASPYHSKYMDQAAHSFKNLLADFNLKDPVFKIISTIDQRIIDNKDEIIKDLVNNINKNINWKLTMDKMINKGIDTFIECGPGKSLLKNGKFIDGDFKIYPLNKLKNIL